MKKSESAKETKSSTRKSTVSKKADSDKKKIQKGNTTSAKKTKETTEKKVSASRTSKPTVTNKTATTKKNTKPAINTEKNKKSPVAKKTDTSQKTEKPKLANTKGQENKNKKKPENDSPVRKSPKSSQRNSSQSNTHIPHTNNRKQENINLIIPRMETTQEITNSEKLEELKNLIAGLRSFQDNINEKIEQIRNRDSNYLSAQNSDEKYSDKFEDTKNSIRERIDDLENRVGEIEISSRYIDFRSFHSEIKDIRNNLKDFNSYVNSELYANRGNEKLKSWIDGKIIEQDDEYDEGEKEIDQGEYDNIKKNCSSRKKYIVGKIKETEQLLEKQRATLKNEKYFNLRYRSIKNYILQIEESLYKMQAYIIYLDKYEKCLDFEFGKKYNWQVLDSFEMSLPDDFPYLGKVYYLKKDDFEKQENNNYYSITLFTYQNSQEVIGTIFQSDYEKLDNQSELPFMVVNINQKETQNGNLIIKTHLSFNDGKLKDAINNNFPVPFVCKRMSLEDENKQAKSVYIKDYDFALKEKLTVSYNSSEGLSIESFDRIIITFNSEDREDFKKLLIENGYDKDNDEWFFRPKEKVITNLTDIIISNVHYAFIASFENIVNDYYVLRFKKLLTEEDKESINDGEIFVSTKVSFAEVEGATKFKANDLDFIKNNPTKYENQLEECSKFRNYLINEFLTQKNMCITDFEIGQYLNKWERLISKTLETSKLELTISKKEVNELGISFIYVEEESVLKEFYDESRSNENQKYKLKYDNSDYNCYIRFYNNYYLEIQEDIRCSENTKIYVWNDSNHLPYKRQLQGLKYFTKNKLTNELVKDAIINPEDINYVDNGLRINFFFNESILKNKSQEDAVRRAFAARSFFIMQGPPGTGKTTVIKELILQQLLHDSSSKILITSQTNVAVDNVLRGLENYIKTKDGITESQVIRLGRDDENSKIAEDLKKYSFEYQFSEFKNKYNKEITDNQIANELRKEWVKLLQNDYSSRKKTNALALVKKQFLKQFKVFGATCVGLDSYLNDFSFDLVIIDEAGKILPGEMVIPINKAKKVIIIGDHKQLPPVIDPKLMEEDFVSSEIISQEERNYFYEHSLFEKIFTKCPPESKAMLNIQFRMPPVIGGLINRLFYDNKLETASICSEKKPLFLNHHLVFVDMAYVEEYKELEDRPINNFEPTVVKLLIEKVRQFYSGRIVVITPYKGQKKLLRSEIIKDFKDVDIDTIDAFQGDEAEVVIYCMTRAVKRTRYFSDDARLNVAFSRTKNTMFMIGSSKYLDSYNEDKKVKQAFEYIRENGRYIDCRLISSSGYKLNKDFIK